MGEAVARRCRQSQQRCGAALHPALPVRRSLPWHPVQSGLCCLTTSQATASNSQSAAESIREEFNLQKSVSRKNGMGQSFGAS